MAEVSGRRASLGADRDACAAGHGDVPTECKRQQRAYRPGCASLQQPQQSGNAPGSPTPLQRGGLRTGGWTCSHAALAKAVGAAADETALRDRQGRRGQSHGAESRKSSSGAGGNGSDGRRVRRMRWLVRRRRGEALAKGKGRSSDGGGGASL